MVSVSYALEANEEEALVCDRGTMTSLLQEDTKAGGRNDDEKDWARTATVATKTRVATACLLIQGVIMLWSGLFV